MNNLTLKEKIGQLFMIGFSGTHSPGDREAFIRENNIGFTLLFSRNIESIPQLIALTDTLHHLNMPVRPDICVDHEGGTVVHFRELAATVISPMALAATGQPKNAFQAGVIIGATMRALGIDGVLAPVLDVSDDMDNPIIGIRSFSDDPDTVSRFARLFAQGLNRGGVFSCGKHFPGHGAARQDSHLEIPEIHIPKDTFQHIHLRPFKEFIAHGADAIMSSHIRFPNLSPHIATFSPELIQNILRHSLGFSGVIMSDCLEMAAVKHHFPPAEIVAHIMQAGVDILIASHDPAFQDDLFKALYDKVKSGVIPEARIDQSLHRILTLKKRAAQLRQEATPIPVKLRRDGSFRPFIQKERRLAELSVTLLRNRRGLIPLNPRGKRILVLEWEKVKASMALSAADRSSMLSAAARKALDSPQLVILPLPAPDAEPCFPESLTTALETADYVIAGVYSRSPAVEALQAISLRRILERRPDAIVVALGNPYDIRRYPEIDSYIAAYGFRAVQMRALFRLITGIIKPAGKIPVNIHPLFQRGDNASLLADSSPRGYLREKLT